MEFIEALMLTLWDYILQILANAASMQHLRNTLRKFFETPLLVKCSAIKCAYTPDRAILVLASLTIASVFVISSIARSAESRNLGF